MGGFSDALGALLESQLSGGVAKKRKRGLQGGGPEPRLDRTLGGGGAGGALDQLLGGSGGGGVAEMLGQLLGGSGGRANAGALEALAGRLLGGGRPAPARDLGGGLMALLGGLAMAAMAPDGRRPARTPVGLRTPETAEEEMELESAAQVVLMAMINAAKADGRIDADEAERIVGKLDELGADREVRDWVFQQMSGPLEPGPMIEAARSDAALAAQVYAATLLAVEVDTAAENRYLSELRRALGLPEQVTERIERAVRA